MVRARGPMTSAASEMKLTCSAKSPALGTILLVHGSAPFNLDGRIPIETHGPYSRVELFRELAEALNRHGWDVLRYAKPGVSRDRVDFAQYKKTDLESIMRQLRGVWRQLPAGKPRVLFAWSEGTLHASQLPLSEASAVVLLGAISTNLRDVILTQAEAEGEKDEAERLLSLLPKKPREEMLGNDRPIGRLVDELGLQENWKHFEEYMALPMLILHGEWDREVPVAQARLWKARLPEHRITVKLKPSGNHMFGTGEAADPDDLARTMHDWLVEEALQS